MCIHRKNKLIIHSYENPTYDEQRIRNSPLMMYLQYVLPYFSKPSKNIYFSPTGPLLVLSTPEKLCKSFGFTRLFDLNTKKHFKTTRRKRLRISFRTNLRGYQHIRNAPLKAHLRTLIPPNR